jgi:hypothetical protein
MKLNEFEAKLATVSDAKLRQMLAAARISGPAVAVTLILSECNRRGMDGLEAQAPSAYVPEFRVPGSETSAYAQEQAGYAGADAPPPPDPLRAAAPGGFHASAASDGSDGSDEMAAADGPPATAPDWLNEESRTGMPPMVKFLLVLIVLGGVLGLVWKFSR